MNKFQTTDAYTSAARPDQSKRGYVSITMKNKVPQVTFTFWIIKIAATHWVKPVAMALSMTLNLGLRHQHRDFLRDFCGHGFASNRGGEAAPVFILDCHC